jgi:hypothetical protein
VTVTRKNGVVTGYDVYVEVTRSTRDRVEATSPAEALATAVNNGYHLDLTEVDRVEYLVVDPTTPLGDGLEGALPAVFDDDGDDAVHRLERWARLDPESRVAEPPPGTTS